MCIVDIYQYSIEMIRYKMIHSRRFFKSQRILFDCLVLSRGSDYEQYFPHVAEFAKYLAKVSRRPALFASYFWWREYYRAEPCDHNIICHRRLLQKVSRYKQSEDPETPQLHDTAGVLRSLLRAAPGPGPSLSGPRRLGD